MLVLSASEARLGLELSGRSGDEMDLGLEIFLEDTPVWVRIDALLGQAYGERAGILLSREMTSTPSVSKYLMF
jgi:hypothetical protein